MIHPFSLPISAGTWKEFILAGKIAGAAGAIGGLFYSPTKKVIKGLRKLFGISESMDLLLTNHLPHIQAAVDDYGKQMIEIRSDVRNLGTEISGMGDRVDDTRAAVHTLGVSFLNHLENVKSEAAPKKVARKR